MNFETFRQSLRSADPPANLSSHLLSLWYDGKDDWERSHSIIQDINDTDAAWIHAYLHRKEGDIGNADYWYHKANKKRPSVTLDVEWEQLVTALLK